MGDQELSSEHVQICVDMSTKSWMIVNFRKPCDLTMGWFSPMHWIFSKVPRFMGTCESICFEDSLIIAVGFISQAVGCTPLWNFVITKCRSCTFSHDGLIYIVYIRPDLHAMKCSTISTPYKPPSCRKRRRYFLLTRGGTLESMISWRKNMPWNSFSQQPGLSSIISPWLMVFGHRFWENMMHLEQRL